MSLHLAPDGTNRFHLTYLKIFNGEISFRHCKSRKLCLPRNCSLFPCKTVIDFIINNSQKTNLLRNLRIFNGGSFFRDSRTQKGCMQRNCSLSPYKTGHWPIRYCIESISFWSIHQISNKV